MTEPHTLSRRAFLRAVAVLGAAAPFASRSAFGASTDMSWLAGDLHAHTVYSEDCWTPWEEPDRSTPGRSLGFTPAQMIALAEQRGLDFLAITDHNTIEHLSDPGYRSSTLTLIPGYEHSLRYGHAGILGVHKRCFRETARNDGALRVLRAAVHKAGGLMLINHPVAGGHVWHYGPSVRPDAVEIWNGVLARPDYAAPARWAEKNFLSSGRMPFTGGSDTHLVSDIATVAVGQPTTWVRARAATASAILDAVRAGRTMITAQPPALGTPWLDVTAEAGTKRARIGDTLVTTRPVDLQVAVRNAGFPHVLRVVVDGREDRLVPLGSTAFETELRVKPRRFVRLELVVDGKPALMTGPIYVARP